MRALETIQEEVPARHMGGLLPLALGLSSMWEQGVRLAALVGGSRKVCGDKGML